MSPEEFTRLLDTFGGGDFALAVDRARQLVGMDGTTITKHPRPVPTKELKDIYRARAANRYIPLKLREQDAEVARVAGAFPDECWYIHNVKNVRLQAAIFSNEQGIGRAGLDFEVPETAELDHPERASGGI